SEFSRLKKASEFESVASRENSSKLILSRPTKLQQEGAAKYLKVVCQNGKLGIQNLKCFLLVDSAVKGYAVAPSEQAQTAAIEGRLMLPYKEVPCKNKIIVENAKDFTVRFLKILDQQSLANNLMNNNKRKILKLSFLVLLEDLSKDTTI